MDTDSPVVGHGSTKRLRCGPYTIEAFTARVSVSVQGRGISKVDVRVRSGSSSSPFQGYAGSCTRGSDRAPGPHPSDRRSAESRDEVSPQTTGEWVERVFLSRRGRSVDSGPGSRVPREGRLGTCSGGVGVGRT